jgi:hypothetical protein
MKNNLGHQKTKMIKSLFLQKKNPTKTHKEAWPKFLVPGEQL